MRPPVPQVFGQKDVQKFGRCISNRPQVPHCSFRGLTYEWILRWVSWGSKFQQYSNFCVRTIKAYEEVIL